MEHPTGHSTSEWVAHPSRSASLTAGRRAHVVSAIASNDLSSTTSVIVGY
jgi:hypothetical protein